MKRSAALVFILLTVAPGTATASSVTAFTRDLAVAGEAERVAQSVPRFTLVGVHWQGRGAVTFRTRSVSGAWSEWRPAAPEAEDQPDIDSSEHRRRAWRVGNPYWTGPSDAIQYRVSGGVRRVRAHFVSSGFTAVPPRTSALASSPPIVPRAAWGAGERRREPIEYASTLRFAVVHHTAGRNNYSAAQSPAIVRAIQTYHVRGNGWNDIGYNFLVDKYGQVFEGRSGGITRNVVGAHAIGFNTGSVGVAVIGNYSGTGITAAARTALARLLAWRLDIAHVDPLLPVSWPSSGNTRFPRGIPVMLRAVSGHRDTSFTSCPGNALYRLLDSLAGEVAVTGGPKLYEPAVTGRVGGPVRFTGRLSQAIPWTVTVTDAAGTRVAVGTGVGTAVDWTWDATLAPPGTYRYAIGAGPTVRAATGTIAAKPEPLAVVRLRATPTAITPTGGGTTISYALSAPALVTANLVDASGAVVGRLFSEAKRAGAHSFVFRADGVREGTYRIVVTAASPLGRQVTASASVLVNRLLAGLSVEPRAFSPNGDGNADGARVAFTLAAPADVRLRVVRAGAEIATIFAGRLPAGQHAYTWSGRTAAGRAPDGTYSAELTASAAGASVSHAVPLAVDTRAPRLVLVSRRPLVLIVSEPAQVTVVVDGRPRAVSRLVPGRFVVAAVVRRTLRAVARDDAGNASTPVRWSG